MTKEITQFKYEQLDESTADFLRKKESNMREIVGKAYTELGKELYEAQQRLARQGSKYDGVFEKWYTHLGWKKQTVYNLINRYNLVQKLDKVSDKDLIEELPTTLSYEIANPNADSTPAKAQAKSEVLAGDISSLKEYRERIKELEKKAEQAEQEAEVHRNLSERLAEEKEQAEQEAQAARDNLEKAKIEAEAMAKEPYGVKLGLAMYEAIEKLSDWQKEYSWIISDETEFRKLIEVDPNIARMFNRVDKFFQQMSDVFHTTRNKGTYTEYEEVEVIDADYSEII